MDVALQRYRFTADQYEELGRAGIIADECRVELIDGDIIEMSPIGARHMYSVAHLNAAFGRGLGDRAVIWPQNALRLGQYLEPQPDIVLLRPPLARYQTVVPRMEDVLLVVEVADSSLHYDREVKVPRYAAAGVPEVWIVDLRAGTIDIHREPTSGGYRVRSQFLRGDAIAPALFPDVRLPVGDILGETGWESPG